MTGDVSVVPSICVFDVNETLLDIDSIAPLFQRLFGDRKVLREWFGQLILYSNAITLSGPYTTFFTLGQGVLKMLGSMNRDIVNRGWTTWMAETSPGHDGEGSADSTPHAWGWSAQAPPQCVLRSSRFQRSPGLSSSPKT